jgi:hypothetical protein
MDARAFVSPKRLRPRRRVILVEDGASRLLPAHDNL